MSRVEDNDSKRSNNNKKRNNKQTNFKMVVVMIAILYFVGQNVYVSMVRPPIIVEHDDMTMPIDSTTTSATSSLVFSGENHSTTAAFTASRRTMNQPTKQQQRPHIISDESKLSSTRHPTVSIDRIYYINSAKNKKQRNIMEGWLSQQSIPHQRIEPAPRSNKEQICHSSIQDPNRCSLVVTAIDTYLNIFNNYNTSGYTLVLQDDFVVDNVTLLPESMRQVPSDFDVVRWNCWGDPLPEFEQITTNIFRTVCTKKCTGWYCGGTRAFLWRGGSSIDKLRQLWSQQPYMDMDCRLSYDTTVATEGSVKSYCINHIPGLERTVPKVGYRHDVAPNKKKKGHNNKHPVEIDRVYYINMNKNTVRRDRMEYRLNQQPIPHYRIEASSGGEEHTCATAEQNQNRRRCLGIAGLALSNIDIIDNYNTTGMTLVLEDDFYLADMERLLKVVNQHVPKDFDVVRINCWSNPHPDFPMFKGNVFQTKCGAGKNQSACINNQGWECGGTHAALWRGGPGLLKLREILAEQPFDDIDCRLTTDKIKSYCIKDHFDIGWIEDPPGEESDIPKAQDAEQ